MQSKSEASSQNTSDKDYRMLVLALGVPENLLETKDIDFDLLYQRLHIHIVMRQRFYTTPLKFKDRWQLEALAGIGESYKIINYNNNLRDNWGATPSHYVAWSGNPAALDWINAHDKDALSLQDKYGRTPIYFAAWSGNPAALDWINAHDKDALSFQDKYGRTPIHYAAWSGNPAALDWINTHDKDALSLQDKYGRIPIYFAAISGNPAALDWINAHDKDAMSFQDKYGRTPIHYAAWSGNPAALDWINTHYKNALSLNDYASRTPIYYALLSGNSDALDWINTHGKDALSLRDCYGRTPIHYAALSGNPQTLNHALALSPSPQSWTLCDSFDEADSKVVTNTLIEALKTNYNLTKIASNGFSMDGISRTIVIESFSRNMAIKQVKVLFIAFMQGLSQTNSQVSLLQCGSLELCSQILNYLLPKGVNPEVIYKEIQTNANHQSRALAIIDKEIKRLEASNQQNNTICGISLERVYQSSDSKISCLQTLRGIIETNPTDLAPHISAWEVKSQVTIAKQRTTICGSFFHTPLTKTQDAVEKIKAVLGVGQLEELDGFMVCQ